MEKEEALQQAKEFNKQGIQRALDGEYSFAIRTFKKALRYIGDNPIIYYNIALASRQRDKHDEAIHYLNGAIKSDPQFVPVYMFLAILYQEKNDMKQANHFRKKAIELDPSITNVQFKLNYLYFESIDKEKVMREIEAEIMKVKEKIQIIEPENTIYPPNIPDSGPLLFQATRLQVTNEEFKKTVEKKLLKLINEISKIDNKLITIYDVQLMNANSQINHFIDIVKQISEINIDSLLWNISEKKEIDQIELEDLDANPLAKTEEFKHRKLKPVKIEKFLLFPISFKSDFTVNECKEYLLSEISNNIEKENIPEENSKIVAITNFDYLIGGTHLDYKVEELFLRAILKLSKEYTFIFADPRNSYGQLLPAFHLTKAKPIITMGAYPSPYNLASYQTYPILNEILANVKIVKSGRR